MSLYLDIDCLVTDYQINFFGNWKFMIKSSLLYFLLTFLIITNTSNLVYSQIQYEIEKLPAEVNSNYEDIKPFTSPNGDSLFFIKSYSPENIGGEHAGEDLWLSIFSENSGWSKATNSFGYKNSPAPDIFIGLSSDNKILYTIDYVQSGKNRLVKLNQYNLQQKSKVVSNKYLPLDIDDNYHDMYLNPDGNILIISMNAINSLGREDLYFSIMDEQTIWSKPTNLGININSRGYEISPFLNDNSKILYFSSNGHIGLGDADIFFSQRLDESWLNWSKPKNMSAPINSPYFDAYFFKNKKNEIFLSSNRNSQYADIYKLTIKENDFGNVEITDNNLMENSSSKTNSKSEVIETQTIYFDLDKSKPNSDELEKLAIMALKIKDANPHNHFIINGYTDNSGKKSYNKKLSEKRARFVYKFLNKNGIDENILSMNGKGVYADENSMDITAIQKRKVEIIEIK